MERIPLKVLSVAFLELRSHVSTHQIARLLFTIASGKIVLLHGFIKKTARIRAKDLNLARTRRDLVYGDYS